MTASLGTLMERYVSLLDNRVFEEWLGLFADNAYYAIIRRSEFEKDNNTVLLGETLPKLRARVEHGGRADTRRTLHLLTGHGLPGPRGGPDIQAQFAVWYDGVPTFAGHYKVEVSNSTGAPLITRLVAVLDNRVISEPIYLPL